MSPTQIIWDLIRHPLQRTRPGKAPQRQKRYHPDALARMVNVTRVKTRRYIAEQRM